MELADYFLEKTKKPLQGALVSAWLAQIFREHFQKRFDEGLVKSYTDIKELVLMQRKPKLEMDFSFFYKPSNFRNSYLRVRGSKLLKS